MLEENAKSDFIGKGCSASVYHAEFKGKKCVKKVFTPGTKSHFFNEKKALAALNEIDCIHFPRLYAVDEENLTIYMEYCGTECIKSKMIPWDWEDQCTDLARHLNGCGIVHGDMAGVNMLVTDFGTIKLIDFGVAEFLMVKVRFSKDFGFFKRKRVYTVLQIIPSNGKYDIIMPDLKKMQGIPKENLSILISKRIIHGNQHNNLDNSLRVFENEQHQRFRLLDEIRDDFLRYDNLVKKLGIKNA